MSLSKEPPTGQPTGQPRQPKCSRCRHHAIIVPQKGHTKICPFLRCDCWKCSLITQRTRVTVLQRNLKRAQNKEPRARVHAGVSAAEGADGAARHRAAPSVPMTDGAPERGAIAAWRPPDLRSSRAAGGGLTGLESGTVRAFASSEERPSTPFNAPCFGEFSQTTPLPFYHFPWMSGFPSSYAPCANLLLNMPWLPPVAAGLYGDGLCGPPMFPQFQSGAVHYPPPPEPQPPADCRPIFVTLQAPPPETFKEELTSRQHPQAPLSKHTEQDIKLV